jgi:glycosyl-4,4'-diaponeurosporenoate acyltransferase
VARANGRHQDVRVIAIVVVDAAVWATWSMIASAIGRRLPNRVLDADTFVTRERAFEDGGRFYERLRIRDWKDRVPEFGSWMGGSSKATLGGRNRLPLFARETRRAEFVHWMIFAAAPVFACWNPPALTLAMFAYAVAANIPFIAIQRYNRLRIARLTRVKSR